MDVEDLPGGLRRVASLSPGSADGRRSLANASLPTQIAAVERIVTGSADLMTVLRLIRELALPEGWLMAGCIYQSIWNALTGRPPRTGIKDYDIGYFDAADLSYEAEDRVIRKVGDAAAKAGVRLALEVRNQARVHLWFEQRFGSPVPPLGSTAEAATRYTTTSNAIAVRLVAEGKVEITAPYGLRDIFAMHLRPNRLLPNGPTHDAKARRCLEIWPEITVEWW
jgi:uncharacterized protein